VYQGGGGDCIVKGAADPQMIKYEKNLQIYVHVLQRLEPCLTETFIWDYMGSKYLKEGHVSVSLGKS
jgi:hypothetical protein